MISYPMFAGDLLTRVLRAGSRGRIVVFVHGTGGRADRWYRNLDPIAAAGFDAIAMDLPGHGFAAKSGDLDHSVPGYTAFLTRFIDAIGAGPVNLVGTSLGGHVAARYASENPERVESLTLVGSMGLLAIGAEARGRIEAGANNQTREGMIGKLHRVIADPALVTADFIDEEFAINNSPGAAASFRKLGAYIGSRLDNDVVGTALNGLPQETPILMVWGAEDKTVPLAVGKAARDLVERSRLAVINGAAHTSYFERPETFNRILLDFLANRTGTSAISGVEYF